MKAIARSGLQLPTGAGHLTRRRQKPRHCQQFLRSLHQIIEPVNDTSKGQLDLEEDGGRKPDGVITTHHQRALALVTAI